MDVHRTQYLVTILKLYKNYERCCSHIPLKSVKISSSLFMYILCVILSVIYLNLSDKTIDNCDKYHTDHLLEHGNVCQVN